ncbi:MULTISPECIES: alpha/beta fold hydrolase [Paraburkholderia]|uniref:Alpha/beta hydrolase n=2 Tax=Paraburkholderia TaxID=1822464 RepID=A0ABU9S7N2_9BURK
MRLIFRIGLILLSVLAALVVAGTGYEALQRYLAAKNHQPPGEMVNIGDRRIQLNCTGNGSPTVVFESGLGISGSLDWSAVQPSVSKVTRACSYSRAGIMWSDRSSEAQDAKSVAEDLHRALQVAGERAPFVLVGQSLGSAYIMTYTRSYRVAENVGRSTRKTLIWKHFMNSLTTVKELAHGSEHRSAC